MWKPPSPQRGNSYSNGLLLRSVILNGVQRSEKSLGFLSSVEMTMVCHSEQSVAESKNP